MADRVVWIDGALEPADQATVPLLAQSVQRGTLVFDVYAVTHLAGRPHGVGGRAHTERFLRSAGLFGYRVDQSVDDLLRIAGEVATANPGCDSLRLNMLWGEPSLDLLPVGDRPVLAVAAYAYADVHGPLRSPGPARLQVPGLRKVPDDVLPVQVKVSASYAHASLAKAAARAAGFHDVLFVDGAGHLTESGSMSWFLVVGDRLLVPPLEDVLDGITRRIVIDLAADEGFDVAVEPIPEAAVAEATESFLASTSRNVWPVGQIGERTLPAPVPGPMTARLASRLECLVAGDDPLAGRWLDPL
jgi:branched-chain amino acid aminotransferase